MLPPMSDESSESTLVPPIPAAPPPVPEQPRKRLAGALVVAAAIGLVVGAGGVGLAWVLSASSGGSAAPAFTLSGDLTLTGDNVPTDGGQCKGWEGYEDIAEGASVTVYDATGEVVATGALGAGKARDTACVFPVSVPGVPGDSKFYAVEISHRGKITVPAADAKAGLFKASLG
jgi:hypothetical protein